MIKKSIYFELGQKKESFIATKGGLVNLIHQIFLSF